MSLWFDVCRLRRKFTYVCGFTPCPNSRSHLSCHATTATDRILLTSPRN